MISPRSFSWKRSIIRFQKSEDFRQHHTSVLKYADLPTYKPHCLDAVKPTPRSTYPSASPRRSNDPWWYRNLNLLSIAYAFRPRLRPRLTLRGRAFLRKPQIFGGKDSHLAFATHANILSRIQSTIPHGNSFCPYTMLLYQSLMIPKLR